MKKNSYAKHSNAVAGWLAVLLSTSALVYGNLAEREQFAYFFDAGGAFWKVEVATNQVIAHSKLTAIDELKKLMPLDVRDGVLVNRLQYDPNLRRLYLAIQKTAWITSEEALYQVFVLELPNLRLVTVFPEKPVDFIPRFLVTPDGGKLLLSTSSLKGDTSRTPVFILETYETQTFKLVARKQREVSEEELGQGSIGNYIKAAQGAFFSETARFGSDGETIYDEGYLIIGDQVVKQTQQPLPVEAERFLNSHPARPYPDPRFLLAKLDSDMRRFLLWELTYQDRTRPIYDGSTGKSWEEKYTVPYATGRFALYDVLAHPKLREFEIKELAGDEPKIVGSTPDWCILYFAKGNKELYAVNLAGDPRAARLDVVGLHSSTAWCFFADH